MVKIGQCKKLKFSKKPNLNENRENINFAEIGEFINFVEIGGIYNMHHWLRGWMPLIRSTAPKNRTLHWYVSCTNKHLATLHLGSVCQDCHLLSQDCLTKRKVRQKIRQSFWCCYIAPSLTTDFYSTNLSKVSCNEQKLTILLELVTSCSKCAKHFHRELITLHYIITHNGSLSQIS